VPDPPAVPLVHWDEAPEHGVEVAVTTRHGGVSAPPYDTLNLGLHVGDDPESVVLNRTRAAAAFGVGLDSLVFARQVHGTKAALVGRADRGRGTRSEADAVAGTDVLVTETPGVTLAILVADCVPLALVDPEAGVLAAVHAGWRGTAAGAVGGALRAMAGCGARAGRVRAFLGPAVHPDRYQVSDEVRRALAEAVRPATPDPAVARPDGPGHWLVDLVAANRQQLREAGVRADHIVESGCTTADVAFFSDRARRPCGRFALLARLVR
jgi:purine-nucleoside/S-methyl-5'-thioadenosine phosphorylase / adenosine deaminase